MDVVKTDGESKKAKARLDLTMDELKGMALDTEVQITITGKVKDVNAPYEYTGSDGSMKKDPYGNATVEISKVKVTEKPNKFEAVI